jgi:hypothetical protein
MKDSTWLVFSLLNCPEKSSLLSSLHGPENVFLLGFFPCPPQWVFVTLSLWPTRELFIILFHPDLEWVSLSGPGVTVGWCGEILLSYYSFLFLLLLCYQFTWFNLALSMEVVFFFSLQCWYFPTRLHYGINQKIIIWTLTTIKTSNIFKKYIYSGNPTQNWAQIWFLQAGLIDYNCTGFGWDRYISCEN